MGLACTVATFAGGTCLAVLEGNLAVRIVLLEALDHILVTGHAGL